MGRSDSTLRAVPLGWVLLHGCWIAAILVAVDTGRTHFDDDPWFASLCDAAFSNGANGPFGYGQNASATRAIASLLVCGAVGAAVLAAYSVRRVRDLSMGVLASGNVAIGLVGGAFACYLSLIQIDANPYCRSGAWRSTVTAVALASIGIVIFNATVGRWVQRRGGAGRASTSDRTSTRAATDAVAD